MINFLDKNISKVYFYYTFYSVFFPFAISNYNDLIVPNGFKVELYASDILAPRQMAEGENYIYVGGIKGNIFAINKKNTEVKYTLASDLNNSRGIAIKQW